MSNIVLLGSPGSGKGTVAHTLHSKAGYVHLSTGDILRSEVEKQSPLGLQVGRFLSEGKLVPDDLMFEVLERSTPTKDNLLFDGFPRTLVQAERLERFVRLRYVFFLKVAEEVAFKRITGRRRCSSCDRLYNDYYKPPKVLGCCDHCNAKLVRRIDDSEEVIKHRLSVFNKTKEEILDFYERRGLIITLDGEGAEGQIQREVFGFLQRKAPSN